MQNRSNKQLKQYAEIQKWKIFDTRRFLKLTFFSGFRNINKNYPNLFYSFKEIAYSKKSKKYQ